MSSKLKLQFSLLIGALLPMALLASYISRHLPTPIPYLQFFIQTEQPSIAWSLLPSQFANQPNPTGVPRSNVLDLQNGAVTSVPYAIFQVCDRAPDGAVTISQFKRPGPGIEIVKWSPNGKESRTLWPVERILPVVNHRYLLSSHQDNIIAFDMDHVGSQRPDAISICKDPQRQSIDDICGIEGTNNILVNRSLGLNSVAVYSITDGQVTEITNWTTGGLAALAVLRQGRIYSLAPDGLSLEVRESSQFEVIQRLPLPANLIGQWDVAAIYSQALVTIRHPQTGASESYRLDDLSLVPELNELKPRRLLYGEIENKRFQLFQPANSWKKKLTVYDSQMKKVALQYNSDYEYVDARIVGEDTLAIVDYRAGLTCRLIDLGTGTVVATYRPLFWPLVCTLMLHVLALVWVIGWLLTSARAGLPAVVDWLVSGAVIAAPMLYRTWNTSWLMASTSLSIFHACWLVLMFAASYNVWFGRSRIVYRICGWLLTLVASTGLLRLRELWAHTSPTAIMIAWVHLLSAALLFLVAARMVTLRALGATELQSSSMPDPVENRNTHLSDLFLLTAIVALLIGTLLPMKSIAQAASQRAWIDASPMGLVGYVRMLSLHAVGTMTLAVWLMFSRWSALSRLGIGLVGVSVLIVIEKWIVGLVDFSLPFMRIKHNNVGELPELIGTCYLMASAWAWRLRRARAANPATIDQVTLM